MQIDLKILFTFLSIVIFFSYLSYCIVLLIMLLKQNSMNSIIRKIELFETVKIKINPILDDAWNKILDTDLLTYLNSKQVPTDEYLVDLKTKYYQLVIDLLGRYYYELIIKVFTNESQFIIYTSSYFDTKFKHLYYQIKSNSINI